MQPLGTSPTRAWSTIDSGTPDVWSTLRIMGDALSLFCVRIHACNCGNTPSRTIGSISRGTPGKTANPINTDRDFRVLMQDSKGKWVEVPKTKWEQHSNDAFAELTFFDKSKCPGGMDPAQQKAWWAEQHGHTPTDRAFREAGRDYSDQIADLRSGQRGNLPSGEVGGTAGSYTHLTLPTIYPV